MWFVLVLCVCACILLFCYIKLSKKLLYWKKKGIPHPPASVLFGNMTEVVLLQKSLPQIYHDIYNEFPTLPYVGFYKAHNPGILIRDPYLAKRILTTDFYSFDMNDLDVDMSSDPFIAANPFFASGDQWRISRSHMTPAFTIKQMKLNFIHMQQVCHRLIQFLKDPIIAKGGIEAKVLCNKYTTDVASICSIGVDVKCFESSNPEFIKAAKKILSPNFLTNVKMTLLFLIPALTNYFSVAFVPKSSGSYFKNIIDQAIEYRKTNNIKKYDFLNSMMELQSKLGADNFTNTDITVLALSYFLDETSSITLSHLLYELGANVNFQDKLRQEIENKMERENKEIDYEFIQELPILNNFINETLRLHLPLMFIGRRCIREYELPPLTSTGKPLVIKPGTSIIIPTYSIQNDSKYFPQPDMFNPNRFEDDNGIQKTGIFHPFGDGPRTCIGQQFALAEAKAAIIYTVLNYDIRVNNKTIRPLRLDPKYFLKQPIGGLWLNFIDRKRIN